MRFVLKSALVGLVAFGLGLTVSALFGTTLAAPLNNVAPTAANSGLMAGSNLNTAADGNLHVFFLRKSQNSGVQPNVKASILLPSNITTADWNAMRVRVMPSGNPALQETAICDVPPTTRAYVRIKVKAGNEDFYPAGAPATRWTNGQICQSGNLFSAFPLPAKPSSQASMTANYYEVIFEVVFTSTAPNSSIRFYLKATGPRGGSTKIGQQGGLDGNDELLTNFPVVGAAENRNQSGGTWIKIPFGSCRSLTEAPVGVYDAENGVPGFGDNRLFFRVWKSGSGYLPLGLKGPAQGNKFSNGNHGPNNDPTRLYPANASNSATSNATLSQAYFDLEADVPYRLEIYGLANRNTIDIAVPGDTILGEVGCKTICTDVSQGCTPEPLEPRRVDITGTIIPGGSAEVGTTAPFGGQVEVSGYPEPEVGGWGYNEVAVRSAINMQIAPTQSPYGATNAGPTGELGTAQRECQNGWAANCGTYHCASGFASSCANYRWRCYWDSPTGTRKFTPLPSDSPYYYTGGANWGTNNVATTCRVIQYQCYDTNGVLQNNYKDFANRAAINANPPITGCYNRWDCPAPAPGSVVTYDPSYGAGVCRIFRCAYDSSGAQRFYWAPGNNPDDQCEIRCNNGAGAFAPKHNEGDENCYVQPYFALRCIWTPNDGQPAFTEVVPVSGNGTNYCPHPVGAFNVGANNISLKACLSLAAASTTGNNFTTDGTGNFWLPAGLQPGHGRYLDSTGALQPFYYRQWSIGSDNTQECVDIYGAPYFKVFGSDARVGGGIGSSGVCQTNTSAEILAHNRGATGGYEGAGTQYAAIATGQLVGFASGLYNNRNANPSATGGGYAAPGTALSFANTGTLSPYGGSFGATGVPGCVNYVPDGMAPTPAPATPITLPALTPGQTTTQYYSGDVFINSNFEYNLGAGLAGLMSYRLVVDGNIYIGKNVTRLDGTYVALSQSDPTKGVIYDCANGVGAAETHTLSGCENQLVINGAFAARSARLLRDCGSLKDSAGDNTYVGIGIGQNNAAQCRAGNNAAEVFNYAPELWLVPLNQPGYTPGADSIRSLPPIL